MKALIATLVAAAFCGSAFAADPVGHRTSNGGYEYYTSTMVGQGSYENGCYLPKQYTGFDTIGYNPKTVFHGEFSESQYCFIQQPVMVVETTRVIVVEQVRDQPVEAAPQPQPQTRVEPEFYPAPQRKHVRE